MEYYIFFLVLFGFACIEVRNYVYQRPYALLATRVIAFVLIVFFIGFRYKIGTDWIVYYEFYSLDESLLSLFSNEKSLRSFDIQWNGLEPGFKVLCLFFKVFFINFFFFQFIATCFFYFALFKLCRYFHNNYTIFCVLLILCFTMFRDFDVLRQNIALGMIMLIIPYIVERKPFKFFLSIVLISTIHVSSLILIPVYFICGFRRVSKVFYLVSVLFFLASFVVPLPLISFILSLAQGVLGSNFLIGKMLSLFVMVGFNVRFGVTTTLPILCILAFLFFFVKDVSRDRKVLVLFYLSICYLYCFILFGQVEEISNRLSYYFFPFIILLFTLHVNRLQLEISVFSLPVVALLVFMRLYVFQLKPTQRVTYFPYYSYFFVSDEDERNIHVKTMKLEQTVTDYYQNITDINKR